MDIVQRARDEKSRAMDERDVGNYDEAIQILDGAIARLEAAHREQGARAGETDLRGFEKEVRKQLYHLLGSKGGVYRRRAKSEARVPDDLVNAVRCYDQGLTFEQHPDFVDSYNLVQRLVARTLMNPLATLAEEAVVEGEALRPALRAAKTLVDEQTSPGSPRSNDEYAFADAAVLALLIGDAGWLDAIRRFTDVAPRSSYARNVTLEVMDELLVSAQAAGASGQPLRERLESASSMLRG